MTDFLSSRLHDAKRFSLKRKDGGDSEAGESKSGADRPDAAEDLSRREQQAAAGQAFRSTAAELSRQRREMLSRLEAHERALEHEQDRLAAHIETVQGLQKNLATLPETVAEDNPAGMRELRRAVESARIELAREARAEAGRAATLTGEGARLPDSLPFRRLLGWGLAFSLPLIMALLLAAALLAYVLSAAFGLG